MSALSPQGEEVYPVLYHLLVIDEGQDRFFNGLAKPKSRHLPPI